MTRTRRRRRRQAIPHHRSPLGDCELSCRRELTGEVWSSGAHRPGRRGSVRRLAPCWAGPARPRPSVAARHQRSRYLGRPGRARPAVRAWPQHRRRSRSPPGGRRAGSVWSWACVLACSGTPSYRLRGVRSGRHRQRPYLRAQATQPMRILPRWVCDQPPLESTGRRSPIGSTTWTCAFLMCQGPGSLHRHWRGPAGRCVRSRPPWPQPRTAPRPGPAWPEGPGHRPGRRRRPSPGPRRR